MAGAAVGLGLGLLALGPGPGAGFPAQLRHGFRAAVPFSAARPGLAPPRAVPSDLAIAVLSRACPADIAQKIVLLSIFVLACSGAAALLDREPLPARLAAGVCYAWNPYVGERLIIGQWALLLGYAGLPWVLRAVPLVRPPGAAGPGAAARRHRRVRRDDDHGAARPPRRAANQQRPPRGGGGRALASAACPG